MISMIRESEAEETARVASQRAAQLQSLSAEGLVQQIFALFDADGDGVLNMAEYGAFLSSIEYSKEWTAAQWEKECALLGSSGPAGIEQRHLGTLYTNLYRGHKLKADFAKICKLHPLSAEGLVQQIFALFDADGDGVLNMAEYGAFLSSIEYSKEWTAAQWEKECALLGSSGPAGIEQRHLGTLYTNLYRGHKLKADFAKICKLHPTAAAAPPAARSRAAAPPAAKEAAAPAPAPAMVTEKYCGPVTWCIGCFICPCIVVCPIDERQVPARQA